MDYRTLKSMSIPEGSVKRWSCGEVVLWEKAAESVNWVRCSINADGSIYNNGLGYKIGYRVRSGGAETGNPVSSCTGYIPVTGGAAVRVSGVNFLTEELGNAINVSDSNFTNIGQIVANYKEGGYYIFAPGQKYASYCFNSVVEEKTGVYKWIAPPVDSGIAYIRVTVNTVNCESVIITVNEEIV